MNGDIFMGKGSDRVNLVANEIRRVERKLGEARMDLAPQLIVYVGSAEYVALQTVAGVYQMYPPGDVFMGHPIVRVLADSYLHVTARSDDSFPQHKALA